MTQPLRPELDEQFRQSLAALYPSNEPSPALAARVAALAAQHEERTRLARVRTLRWRLAAAVGAVILAAAVFQLVRPTLAAAALLARMDGAMRGVRSTHYVLNTLVPNGTWVKTDETWYQGGQRRTQGYGVLNDVQVYAHRRLWVYRPQDNTVTVRRKSGPFFYNTAGFSVGAILGSGAVGMPPALAQQIGTAPCRGRPAVEIALVTPVQERLIFRADPVADLPFHFEAQRMTPWGWKPVWKAT